MASESPLGEPQVPLERLLISEGVRYSLVEVGQQALNALLLPLFFFFLSVEDFGVITWALVISQITMLLSTGGLDFSLMRLYYVWPVERRTRLSSGIWVVSLAWSGLVATIAFVCIIAYSGSAFRWPLLFGAWAGLALGLRNIPLSLVRVTGAMRTYTTAELGGAIARVLCQIALIWFGLGATGYMGGYLLGSILSMLLLLGSPNSGIRWQCAQWRLESEVWRYTWRVLPSIAFTRLIGVADRMILFSWSNIDALGVYGAASRFTTSLKFLTGGFKLALAPAFSRAEVALVNPQRLFSDLSRLMLLTMLLGGSAVMLAVWTVQFTPWAARSNEVGRLAGVLLLAQFFGGLASIGQVRLYYSSEPQNASFVIGTNAVILVIAVAILVPRSGAMGAAAAQAIAAGVSVGIMACLDVRGSGRLAVWRQFSGLIALFIPSVAVMWVDDRDWQLSVLVPTFLVYGLLTVSTIHRLRDPIQRYIFQRRHA